MFLAVFRFLVVEVTISVSPCIIPSSLPSSRQKNRDLAVSINQLHSLLFLFFTLPRGESLRETRREDIYRGVENKIVDTRQGRRIRSVCCIAVPLEITASRDRISDDIFPTVFRGRLL